MFAGLEPDTGTSLTVRDLGLDLVWEIGRAPGWRSGVADVGAPGEVAALSETFELLLLGMV